MRWIIYIVGLCIVIDFLLIQYNVRHKADVFAPGIYIVLSLLVLLYTILSVVVIDKKSLFAKRTLLSIFILSPCFIYIFIHVLVMLAHVFSWIISE